MKSLLDGFEQITTTYRRWVFSVPSYLGSVGRALVSLPGGDSASALLSPEHRILGAFGHVGTRQAYFGRRLRQRRPGGRADAGGTGDRAVGGCNPPRPGRAQRRRAKAV